MPRISCSRQYSKGARRAALGVLVWSTTACAMAGFGGALQLNITDQQVRPLAVEIDAGDAEATVYEIGAQGETELGAGPVATIDRYLLQRASFGNSATIGYFLCEKPCRDPLDAYLVAYSPEQVITSSGELELQFRIEAADGASTQLTRTITGDMLPELWRDPKIVARAAQR